MIMQRNLPTHGRRLTDSEYFYHHSLGFGEDFPLARIQTGVDVYLGKTQGRTHMPVCFVSGGQLWFNALPPWQLKPAQLIAPRACLVPDLSVVCPAASKKLNCAFAIQSFPNPSFPA
jgi:hypothetical protein